MKSRRCEAWSDAPVSGMATPDTTLTARMAQQAGQTVAQLAHRNVVLETVHDNTVETIKTCATCNIIQCRAMVVPHRSLLCRFFGRLTHPMRKTTLCALLDEHTTTWQGVMKHMLKTVSPAMLSDLVVKVCLVACPSTCVLCCSSRVTCHHGVDHDGKARLHHG